ncbi:MAG: hypothetical protein Q9160_004284 [Pyrenula sp. 1 TL-2023]
MSHYAANNGLSPNSRRPQENAYWRAANRGNPSYAESNGQLSGAQIGSKITDYFSGGKDLPLYKDKPQPHYGTRRRKGFLRSRKTLALICLGVFALITWLRPFSTSAPRRREAWKGGDIFDGLFKADAPSKTLDWSLRRDLVKEAFVATWNSYSAHAWGMDEYHPISKKGRNMVEGGLGWIVVDALDTAMIMNLTSQVKEAREWISTSLHYTADHEVNTFETTIRMLGGLLSAHYLSTTYPNLAPQTDDDVNQPGEDLYIEKATDLADRLLGAFDSPTGIAYASINLNTSIGVGSDFDMGASSTAEAATLQLEFKYLAKLTGEAHYWAKAEKVMEVIDSNHMPGGLLPIFIYPRTGAFRGDNIRLGSRGDSYYEYLIKQYLQTDSAENVYLDMWNEALEGIKRHLLVYSKHANLTVLAERQNGLDKPLTPKMDHLVCFMPGTIALAVTGGVTVSEAKKRGKWGPEQEENMQLARELMKTCWATYKATATGLAPEITYFEIDDPARMYYDTNPETESDSSKSQSKNPSSHPTLLTGAFFPSDTKKRESDQQWRRDIDIHANDVHNLQRPETVESLFYMYRVTGDQIYRDWGWEMFKSFVKHTAVLSNKKSHYIGSTGDDSAHTPAVYAFTSLDDVQPLPREPLSPTDISALDISSLSSDTPPSSSSVLKEPRQRDNVESFWLAETLKYFYLLFGEEEFLPLNEVVWNTEAHVFPRWEMGKNFGTGWERKKKDEEGKGGEGEERKVEEGKGKSSEEKVVKVEDTGKSEA